MSELRPLRELLDPERETEPGFAAMLEGEPVMVTAVLERTVVYYRVSDRRKLKEKHLVLIERVLARPQDVRSIHLKPQSWHGRPPPKEAAKA